jgi:lysophospholipase L1-like esterase
LSAAPGRIGRASGAAIQVVAAAGVTALLLLLAEGTARMIVGPPAAAPPPALGAADDDYVTTTLTGLEIAPELNPSPLVHDAFVLWRNTPNARKTQPVNPRPYGRHAVWTIENDSRGYRGPERRGAGDVFRVLCLGDSVTFGFNVDQPAPFPRQLEMLLRERLPERQIEVVNAGVPGWSWVQGLRFLEAEGMRLAPDLVVAAHGTNDQFWRATRPDRERLPAGGQPAPEMRPATFVERTSLYRLIARMSAAPESAGPSARCRAEIARDGMCRRVPVDDIETTIRDMHRLVRANGVDLLVLNLDFMGTAAVDGARRAAQADGIAFVDFVERFRTLRRADEDARAARLALALAGPLARTAPSSRRVVFRVLRPPDAGGGAMTVRGGAYLRDDVRFQAMLRDDGTGGDERAGDGVFSGAADVPPGAGMIEYTYWLGDTCEFTPLPPLPSTSGTRLLPLRDDTLGPVEQFGDAFLMAERTHPDARGHAVIAAALADLIASGPPFGSRHAGAPRSPE